MFSYPDRGQRGGAGLVTAVVLMSWILLHSLPASAAVLEVCATCKYTTIQAAINAAANGDIVRVHPGTYVENVDFLGKAITVESVSGAGSTFIDGFGGGADGACVRFVTNEIYSSILDGFTLLDGRGQADPYSPSLRSGGGIFINGANPTVRNCIIGDPTTPNDVTGFGDGIAVFSAPIDHLLLIENCTVRDSGSNVSTPADQAEGVYIKNSGSTWLSNCEVKTSGIGVYVVSSDEAMPVTGAIVACNIHHGSSTGVVVEGYADPFVIDECNIHDNVLPGVPYWYHGGGIRISGTGANPRISYNAITNNRIPVGLAGYGGGIAVGVGARPLIENNTISGNEVVTDGGGVWVGFGVAQGVLIRNNTIQGNIISSGAFSPGLQVSGGDGITIEGNTLSDNIFLGNPSSGAGGGIYLAGGIPNGTITVRNNTVTSNQANGIGVEHGGTSYAVVLDGNTVSGNAHSGITTSEPPAITGIVTLSITNNRIFGNGEISSADAGVKVRGHFRVGSFSGNVLGKNSGLQGAGLYLGAGLAFATSVASCTIADNNSSLDGSAVYVDNASLLSVDGTIIAFNGSPAGSVEPVECGTGTITVSCTDIYGNDRGDWVGCLAGLGGQNNNFSADPLFCNAPKNDYTIRDTSPCVDAPGCGLVGALGVGCVMFASPGGGQLERGNAAAVEVYSNPLNPAGEIRYATRTGGRVAITVYDSAGRAVGTIFEGRLEAGSHRTTWRTNGLATGVYFIRVESPDGVGMRKGILLK